VVTDTPTLGPFAEFQNEVYLKGLFGEQPTLPFGWRETEAAAYAAMTPEAVGYVAGGAGGEETMRANREAFDRWRLVPRMLRGIPAQRDHTTTVLGTTMPAPVLLAPVGVLSIVHPDAESAVARAAKRLGLTMLVSTASSTTMEDGRGAGQLALVPAVLAQRPGAGGVVRAARGGRGYGALVVTLDTWQLGWRPRDLSRAYLPFLKAVGVANYFSDPVFTRGLPPGDEGAAVLKFVGLFNNPTLTWDDLAWLRGQTTLPIVLKGVQHPDDVRRALDCGVQAVVCSNHGGRQVDGAIGSLDALPALVEASDLPVLFDSGIRTGADACKALALGAQAVLLGRPWVHGLALGGEEGVHHVLRSFLADLDLQAGLSGHRSTSELSRTSLART
jgi:isopentenyl diphosphate isomerase/L-lactate dehydrogenase-like FMN-dependent dehydrogenase